MSAQTLSIAPRNALLELYHITVSRAEREAAAFTKANLTKGPMYKILQIPLDPPSYCNLIIEPLNTAPIAAYREVN